MPRSAIYETRTAFTAYAQTCPKGLEQCDGEVEN